MKDVRGFVTKRKAKYYFENMFLFSHIPFFDFPLKGSIREKCDLFSVSRVAFFKLDRKNSCDPASLSVSSKCYVKFDRDVS